MEVLEKILLSWIVALGMICTAELNFPFTCSYEVKLEECLVQPMVRTYMGLLSTSDVEGFISSRWTTGSPTAPQVSLAPVSSPAQSQHAVCQDLRCTGSSPRKHRSVASHFNHMPTNDIHSYYYIVKHCRSD